MALKIAVALAMAGIAAFGALNLRSLAWNLAAYRRFRQTEGYKALRASNGESAMLAMPLALAMSVKVGFILGLVFVPGLWGVVEYLFPLAMVAFALIGGLALALIADFLGRVLSQSGLFDVTAHNSFAQLLRGFALAMVAVGFAPPAAMSGTVLTVARRWCCRRSSGLPHWSIPWWRRSRRSTRCCITAPHARRRRH